MHAVVQATRRMPGPSTAEPVVNEWRNPMSPLRSAERTSVSASPSPSLTRISNGLPASSGTGASTFMSRSVESSVDHVHLLLAGQPDEIDRIARHPDGEDWIFFRMLHRIDQGLAIQHVHVHVVAGRPEEGVEDRDEIGELVVPGLAQAGRNDAGGERDPVLGIAIGD